jgi:cytochrome c oxidase subunit IV
MSQPRVSLHTYVFTWLGLLALTLLTSLLGLVNLGRMSLIVALFIAGVKASLIAGFFMHVFYDSKLVRVVVVAGVIWFLILVSLTMGDYFTRGWLPFPGK